MSSIWLDLPPTEPIAEFVESGCLGEGLTGVARLVGADLQIDSARAEPKRPDGAEHASLIEMSHRGEMIGRVFYEGNANADSVRQAADSVSAVLEHAHAREVAVNDLAKEMIAGYEELTMLYSLLPSIATREDAREIGQLLVDESARLLNCHRVSLLVLDEREENLKVLASRGLPDEAKDVLIPVDGSISGQALLGDDFLVVNDLADRPDLMALSQGDYDTDAFSIVRVPLQARGNAIGVLTATERQGGAEFTSRECKLLAGLSSVGSSALMNCRLHATINRQMLSTIEALALAVDAKDPYTHDHSKRVSQLAVAVARHRGIDDASSVREYRLAGLLHDIGKIGVADDVLSKKGKLTPQEFGVIRSHVQVGARIVGRVEGLEGVAKAILHHHERYDGLGYPSGLSGDDIPTMAKVVAAADVYDCLISDRPYRKAMTKEAAVAELTRCQGSQFDPSVIDALLAVLHT